MEFFRFTLGKYILKHQSTTCLYDGALPPGSIELIKLQDKGGPFIDLAFDIQQCIVGLENPMNNRKTESGAGSFGGKKGGKN